MITVVFYYHPSTTNVNSFFRTITILPEIGGRVVEVYVTNNQRVAAGDRLFKLDGTSQAAAAETARRRIAEFDAGLLVAKSDLDATTGAVKQARADYKQTREDLGRQQTLLKRRSSAVRKSEIDRLKNLLNVRQGAMDVAIAQREAIKTKISKLLPAQKATSEASLAQANAELAKLEVKAGVAGTLQQFTLRPGDYVNPILRPAGILVPAEAGRGRIQAGFG